MVPLLIINVLVKRVANPSHLKLVAVTLYSLVLMSWKIHGKKRMVVLLQL